MEPNLEPTAPAPAATRVWEARTGSPPDPLFLAYSESVADDEPFLDSDLAGSIAHVAGLHKAGLLATEEATTLIEGLQGIYAAYAAGDFRLDPDHEDVHMNIEHRLTAALGPVAGKLHTGRSRNDQVALDLVLFARRGLALAAEGAHRLAAALATAADEHAETPWVARTHGQPAQPATLGFLLAAHAIRFQDAADEALEGFAMVGESPLGAGAVAGSSLPLQPAATASLLGLRPLRSALLATGTRDVVVRATSCAAHLGLASAALASDLLALHAEGAYAPPAAFTSGSSLMPQKRNPDALELARGKGKALSGPHHEALALLGGLGLGYHRDFQATKPLLVKALRDAVQTLQVLVPHVEQGTFNADVLARGLTLPGITATDVAESLVASGLPFREAYAAVAHAVAASVERGVPFENALAQAGLGKAALAAAKKAAKPDASRRSTLGGPAPARVRGTLAVVRGAAHRLDGRVQDARLLSSQPYRLLSETPTTILASIHGEE